MEDLSLHVLDIVENSIRAGATLIDISIDENTKKNILIIRIKDNGHGINKKDLNKVLDPFYTTKKGKKIGLGLALLAQSAQEAQGDIRIQSEPGKGCEIVATFVYDNIDRKPLGNTGETIMALIGTHADKIDFIYQHRKNNRGFEINTREIRSVLDGVPIFSPAVMSFLRQKISGELRRIKAN
jgi:anti-sigma regulatory factor (Ser/Thr protein kinase)